MVLQQSKVEVIQDRMSTEILYYRFCYSSVTFDSEIFCIPSTFENNKQHFSEKNNDIKTPLFTCKVYNDPNYLLNYNKSYLEIYEDQIHSNSLVGSNISDKRSILCKIKNKRPIKEFLKISRIYEIKLQEKLIKLVFYRFHDYIKVISSDSLMDGKWIFKQNTENVFTGGLSLYDDYTLILNGAPVANYKSFKNKFTIGSLEILLKKDVAVVISMVFVLITHQRFKKKTLVFTNGLPSV
ncbi:hypothetical protein QEN19_000857 [Hanseniaspora menglaensis]